MMVKTHEETLCMTHSPLSDPGIEQRGLESGIGADQQQDVRFLHPDDLRVQEVVRAQIRPANDSCISQRENKSVWVDAKTALSHEPVERSASIQRQEQGRTLRHFVLRCQTSNPPPYLAKPP